MPAPALKAPPSTTSASSHVVISLLHELHERWEQARFLVCSNQLNKKVPKPLQVRGRRAQTLCKWQQSISVDPSFRLAEGGQLAGETEVWTSVWMVD